MNKTLNYFALIFFGCFLSVCLFHCTKNREEVPLFDGMYLTYKDMSSCWEETYQVSNIGEGKYKLLKKKGCPGGNEILQSPVKEYFFDKYGRISKSTDERRVGKRIDIWIPPSELDGSSVPPSFGASDNEVERKAWEKWDVLAIKSKSMPVEIFYDVKTGFEVGWHTGEMPGILSSTHVLVDTNTNIPTAEK